MRLRLAFMGTPDFAVPTLRALIAAGHEIAAVYSQPPRPAGRGYGLAPSPVQRAAQEAGLPVRTPKSLRGPEEQAAFRDLGLDAAVVVAYGLILPPAVLWAPRLGCFNLHASILPRWRGAAPIQRAIWAGDEVGGVSVMAMTEGLDEGPVVIEERMELSATETGGSLHDRLAELGAPLMVDALALVASGRVKPQPQPAEGVTYATKIRKEDARIDWTQGAEAIERQVRALNPAPGAFTDWRGERLKILAAEVVEGIEAAPGTVVDERLTIACGRDGLRPRTLQRAGRGALGLDEFLRGQAIAAGERLG